MLIVVLGFIGIMLAILLGFIVINLCDAISPKTGLTVLGVATWVLIQVSLLAIFGSTFLTWTPTLLISQALSIRFTMKGVRELMILSNQNSKDEKQLGKIELSD